MGLEKFVSGDNGDDNETDTHKSTKDRGRKESAADHIRRVGHERYIKIITMFRTRDRYGNYMGPDPPSKFEVPKIPEEDWDDRWIDATGDFEYKDDRNIKYTDCKYCFRERIWTGSRGRYVRCPDCGAVHMDRHWKDDRVDNPNLKKGLEQWS